MLGCTPTSIVIDGPKESDTAQIDINANAVKANGSPLRAAMASLLLEPPGKQPHNINRTPVKTQPAIAPFDGVVIYVRFVFPLD